MRDGARTVDITVSDDGPGVAGSDSDPFAAGTKAPDSPGAGLGLALAQRVAHTLGGDVTLTSHARPHELHPHAPQALTRPLTQPADPLRRHVPTVHGACRWLTTGDPSQMATMLLTICDGSECLA